MSSLAGAFLWLPVQWSVGPSIIGYLVSFRSPLPSVAAASLAGIFHSLYCIFSGLITNVPVQWSVVFCGSFNNRLSCFLLNRSSLPLVAAATITGIFHSANQGFIFYPTVPK